MVLTNQQIYNYVPALTRQFSVENCDIKLPIKINFFLQKNIKLLIELIQEIEKCRLTIAAEYGTLNEEKSIYEFTPENESRVNQELKELFAITQDVPIHMFHIDDFNDLELTFAQMSAIMFMIEE